MSTSDPQSSAIRPERAVRLGAAILILGLFVVFLVVYLGEPAPPRAPRTLVLYAFSTMDDALRQGVFPAFQEQWQSVAGERVEPVATFAGSGAVTSSIIRRVPAEVAILSSRLDVVRLIEAGALYRSPASEGPQSGIVTRSPLVLVVRPGNPLAIAGFEDLARPGVAVVHADPTTSGCGQWSVLAEYGSALRRTGDAALAYAQLAAIEANVHVEASSAREARARFEAGEGDVLVTYEHDALASPARPAIAGKIVYPPDTIVTEHPVVRLDRNVSDAQRELVDAFIEFLRRPETQKIFVDYGFRSPQPELGIVRGDHPGLPDSWAVDALGGPRQAKKDIIDGLWYQRIKKDH